MAEDSGIVMMSLSHDSKAILVTGAAGFIGSQFVQRCYERKISTVSVDSLPHFYHRPEHKTDAREEKIDREVLFDWLKKNSGRLRAMIHLGAITRTTEMDRRNLEIWNVTFSQRLWNEAVKAQIPFYYASSAATYGRGEFGYDDAVAVMPKLCPLNPYGDSKHKFDLWVLDQELQGRTKVPPYWAGFKFFNVYGPGERHKGFMSSVVLQSFDQIRETGVVRLFRSDRAGIVDGDQRRDFIFVGDVVDVLLFAIEHPLHRGIFNLGTGVARSFLDLVRAVFRSMGKLERIDFIPMPIELQNQYQYFTQATMERLREAGYRQPFTSLEDGVAKYCKGLMASA